uniref:Phosphoinositide phospholipase C n=1 Tax=Takifugu rubripes TaxID=31033 RepID=A0A674NLN6_TAKRU
MWSCVGDRVLEVLWSCVGDRVLEVVCWRSCVGGHVVVCWRSCVGGPVVVCWRSCGRVLEIVCWRCCGHVLEVLWSCVGGHVVVCWRSCGRVLEVLWSCVGGRVLEVLWSCVGDRVLEVLWSCVGGHVVVCWRSCVGGHVVVCWRSCGRVLEVMWSCVGGRVLEVMWSCVGDRVLEVLRSCVGGHVVVCWRSCVGGPVVVCWRSCGRVLEVLWSCVGGPMVVCWRSCVGGHVLEVLWSCVGGRVLEVVCWRSCVGGPVVVCWRSLEKCMRSMQMGTQMVKLRGGSRGLVRFFYLDEHKSCIRWRPSRKNEKAKIAVDSIREIREGKQSEIFQRYSDGSFDPNCCFSLYYGEHMASLDLVTGTGEEARTWITGLRYLMAGISDEDSLAKRQRTRDQYPYFTFSIADVSHLSDKNGDGSLSISEVLQLLHKLNVNLPRQKVKQMFKEADTDQNQGTLGFEEFCSFYKMMSTRRDLYLLMLTYSNLKDHLDIDDLARFLNTEQKMTKVTRDHCLEIVTKFEPSSDNQKQGLLGIDGFTNYMRSPAADIFNPDHYSMNQDMNQPLCNYFIASSHNTYLTGDQLMSQSRVDMYAWVLQAGCRCIEVDCWDGPDGEPIVHHGYTLTSKILFRDVIETINKYAFIKTEYPVILSIENHCSVPQQKKMAQYLTEIFGDKLNLSSIKADTLGRLPSPEALKGRILVKGKKLPPNIDENAEEGDVSDEDSADEMEDDCKLMNGDTSAIRKQVENMAKKKLDSLLKESKIRDREDPDSFTITALPPAGKATQKNSFKVKHLQWNQMFQQSRTSRSFMESFSKRKVTYFNHTLKFSYQQNKKTMKLSRALSDLVKYTQSVGLYDIEAQANCNWQVSSLSETKAHQLMQHKAASFIHFNQQQLSRIYPSSYRVDSSNFNPQPFWNAGCQLVALNYQTEGRVLQLNRAKFYSNGNCGYILKPACMCEGNFNPNLEDPLPARMKKQLVIKIISGQQLPKPKDSMLGDRGEIIDPFVEVEVIGLPVDCCKGQTRVVDDNGFNPMWEETLVFTIHMPDLALVRFLVWDHDPIGQDFIGQRTIAFNSMMPGYRHVYLEGMEEASVFVHIAVNDVTGKVGKARTSSGIKGIFHKHPKQASLDSHAAAQHSHKHPFGAHLLRRTASAPTKGQPKTKKGFPEITNDNSSEGAGEDEPLKRVITSSGRVGLSSNCITCVMGSKDSPETERKCLVKEQQDRSDQAKTHLNAEPVSHTARPTSQQPVPFPKHHVEAQFQYSPQVQLRPVPCGSLSSLSSWDSPPMLPPCSVFDSRKRAVGTLQRELNALFTQKMEELHLKSPMFFAGKIRGTL